MEIHLFRWLICSPDFNLFPNLKLSHNPTDFGYFLSVNLAELFGAGIMVYFRVTDDLFIQLNRERTLFKISIFQYDYLGTISPKLLNKIHSAGTPRMLREEIDYTMTMRQSENINTPLTVSTKKYIDNCVLVEPNSAELRQETSLSVRDSYITNNGLFLD